MRSSISRAFRFSLGLVAATRLLGGCSSQDRRAETTSAGQGGSAPLVRPGVGGASGAANVAGGGQGGAEPSVTSGGGAAAGGLAGSSAGGGVANGGSASGSAGAAGASSSGGASSPSAQCAEIEAEYATSLAEQVACNSAAGDQCDSRVEAAPGCDCRVVIEPKDPYAIEHLLNLQADWFDADCENPKCPSDCAEAARGSCAANGECAP